MVAVMGVKGRRVAVVEEMSKTVISFQKGTSPFIIRGSLYANNISEVRFGII